VRWHTVASTLQVLSGGSTTAFLHLAAPLARAVGERLPRACESDINSHLLERFTAVSSKSIRSFPLAYSDVHYVGHRKPDGAATDFTQVGRYRRFYDKASRKSVGRWHGFASLSALTKGAAVCGSVSRSSIRLALLALGTRCRALNDTEALRRFTCIATLDMTRVTRTQPASSFQMCMPHIFLPRDSESGVPLMIFDQTLLLFPPPGGFVIEGLDCSPPPSPLWWVHGHVAGAR